MRSTVIHDVRLPATLLAAGVFILSGCERQPAPAANAPPPAIQAAPAASPAPQAPSARGARYPASTPLFVAVADGDVNRVVVLLEAGENPNEYIQDHDGAYTVMHTAARLGHASIIRVLAQHGGDPNVRSTASHSATPLHWATRSNRLEAVIALLDAGADIHAVTIGRTPLQLAILANYEDLANYLRSRGAKH